MAYARSMAVSPASFFLIAFTATDTETARPEESSARSGCNSAPRLNFGKETSDTVLGDH